MNWITILNLIGRVLFAVCLIVFSLSSLLSHKHETFANLLVATAIIVLGYGFVSMFIFVLFG